VFTSKIVKGKSFQFQGTVERGEGKSRADEAYYVLQGTLVENTTDAAKKISSRSVDVLLRSFPQDLAPPPPTERKIGLRVRSAFCEGALRSSIDLHRLQVSQMACSVDFSTQPSNS